MDAKRLLEMNDTPNLTDRMVLAEHLRTLADEVELGNVNINEVGVSTTMSAKEPTKKTFFLDYEIPMEMGSTDDEEEA